MIRKHKLAAHRRLHDLATAINSAVKELTALRLPRLNSAKSDLLSRHLDAIHHRIDDAIHKGYCLRNVRKLDDSLAAIIKEAEAARKLLKAKPRPDVGDENNQPPALP